MKIFADLRIAFGESDEYSFVFHKSTKLYGEFLFSYLAFSSSQLTCQVMSSTLNPALPCPP